MTLLQQRFRGARGAAEQTIKAVVGHPQPDAIIEIFLIEVKRAVWLEVY